jgi:hypothetical protein
VEAGNNGAASDWAKRGEMNCNDVNYIHEDGSHVHCCLESGHIGDHYAEVGLRRFKWINPYLPETILPETIMGFPVKYIENAPGIKDGDIIIGSFNDLGKGWLG